MYTGSDPDTDTDEDYAPAKKVLKHQRPHKRHRPSHGQNTQLTTASSPTSSLKEAISSLPNFLDKEPSTSSSPGVQTSFEGMIEPLLSDLLLERETFLMRASQQAHEGNRLRPISRYEISQNIKKAEARFQEQNGYMPEQAITARKLKLDRERRRAHIPKPRLEVMRTNVDGKDPSSISPLLTPKLPEHVLHALCQIRRTQYESSFLARLHGSMSIPSGHIISVDWETATPWMTLMADVREHYSLLHADREQPSESIAPIVYMCLQEWHLDQVHELLRRVFWAGISVRDSLEYTPERCTVVATYKRLVVGVAILSSPQETYITYLAVKAGWEGAKIATCLLYHLIKMNPSKDISLHVSANNPAMLLYNRFGFKAEEFVVGFYENYLDPQSHASKNAFRLRLRQNRF